MFQNLTGTEIRNRFGQHGKFGQHLPGTLRVKKTKKLNIPIWENQNGDKSAILNYNCPKLWWTHGTEVRNRFENIENLGSASRTHMTFWRNALVPKNCSGVKSGILNSNFPKLGWTHGTEVTNKWVITHVSELNVKWFVRYQPGRTDWQTHGQTDLIPLSPMNSFSGG